MLEWALTIGCDLYEAVFDAAAENGRVKALKWLKNQGCPWEISIWESSVLSKNKDALVWLLENFLGIFDNQKCLQAAATAGNLEALKILLVRNPVAQDSEVLDIAVLGGHTEMIDWLLIDQVWNFTPSTTMNTCMAGNFELLKRAYASGCALYKPCFANAALGGHFEILKWLEEHNCPRSTYAAAEAAAKGGHLDILKWLIEKEFTWSSATTTAAIVNGHLDILKWSFAHGCPMDFDTALSDAARNGHIHILDWLWENFRSFCSTSLVFFNAAEKGHLEALRWAKRHFCSWDQLVLRRAAFFGHLDALKWMKRNGIAWKGKIPREVAYYGNLRVLRWLTENGVECEYEALGSAIQSDHLKIVKYLIASNKWASEDIEKLAVSHNSRRILRWLRLQHK
jgi:hypothetical protein